MTEQQETLIVDLLTAYRTNLQGHREAILEVPELVEVAGDGLVEVDAQIALVDQTLETFA